MNHDHLDRIIRERFLVPPAHIAASMPGHRLVLVTIERKVGDLTQVESQWRPVVGDIFTGGKA